MHFTSQELSDIEAEALEARRACYAAAMARVDDGLLKRAARGDAKAAKLCYQRFEGWSERMTLEDGGEVVVRVVYEDGRQDSDNGL